MSKGRLVTVEDIQAHPELSKRGISVNQYHDFDNDPLLQEDNDFEQEDDEVIYQPAKKAEVKKVYATGEADTKVKALANEVLKKAETPKKEVAKEAPKKAAAPKKAVVTKAAPQKAEAKKAAPKKGSRK